MPNEIALFSHWKYWTEAKSKLSLHVSNENEPNGRKQTTEENGAHFKFITKRSFGQRTVDETQSLISKQAYSSLGLRG